MGTFGNYLEDELLDHFLGKGSYTPPTIYIGLSTADPTEDGSGMAEPSTGSYARVTTSGSDWAVSSGGESSNANALSFPESTAAWSGGSSLTHFALFDAASDGNMLAHGALTTSRAVDAAGITLQFTVGELVITLD